MLHFKEFQKENRGVSMAAMRKKLYGALAMLLVASTLMVTSTYAWFVLSTAPEVTGIETQVGANGALEIALLNTASYNDLLLVTDADFDEGAVSEEATVMAANLNWGNLVDLSDSSYGLANIVLMPARLNISQTGEGAFTVNTNTLLKTPKYGEDGRILALEQTAVSATYDKAKAQFSNTDGYGVRAVGTAASMSVFQRELNSTRGVITNNMNAAKAAATSALNTTGDALANIAVKHALTKSGEPETYTKEDIEALKALAVGMKTALDYIDTAMRQVYVGYICSDYAGNTVTDETLQSAKEAILNTATWDSLKSTYPGLNDRMSTYINLLNVDRTKVDSAISGCQAKIDANQTSYTWAEISGIMSPLVDYTGMKLNGQGIADLQTLVSNEGVAAAASLILQGGGLNVTVPTGSGLVSDVADFCGDYTASVTVRNVSAAGQDLGDVGATMSTTTTANPLHLTQCASIIRSFTAKDGTGSNAITDFYGYALDFAVRTNAAGKSHLLLQTESTNRIYDGDTQNANLQGGGSFMQFVTQSGISATKMVRMMRAIRVMFIAKEGNTYGIAALDCTLGKDVYRQTTEAEKAANKNLPYVLDNTKTGLDVQYSDCITQEAYDALPAASTVEFNGAGQVKAKLYLYGFTMTMAGEGDNAHQTGGLTLGNRKATAEIMELQENEAAALTALVYLDGSYVHNSEVASTNTQSMKGILNLQFASDAELVPAENTALRMGPQGSAPEPEEPETP